MMSSLDRVIADAGHTKGPASVMLMRVLGEAQTEADARAALDNAIAQAEASDDKKTAERLRSLHSLWAAHPSAWTVVRSTLANISHEGAAGGPDAVLRYWGEAFDRLAAASPEASVALYSLGSSNLLASVTDEVVHYMQRLGLLDPAHDVLDLGCGIGRFLVALAPRSRQVLGLDLSAGMVAEARRRCRDLSNVQVEQTTGRNLSAAADLSRDLILAVDVFPYLVQAGGRLAEEHFAEFRRVLRPGGAVLVLNYSYRDDIVADCCDFAAFAAACTFVVEKTGTRDLALWDGSTFLARKLT